MSLSYTAKFESELQQAAKAKDALDGIRKTLGTAKGLAIAEVADVPTAAKLSIKSSRAIRALKNPVYGIEFEKMTH